MTDKIEVVPETEVSRVRKIIEAIPAKALQFWEERNISHLTLRHISTALSEIEGMERKKCRHSVYRNLAFGSVMSMMIAVFLPRPYSIVLASFVLIVFVVALVLAWSDVKKTPVFCEAEKIIGLFLLHAKGVNPVVFQDVPLSLRQTSCFPDGVKDWIVTLMIRVIDAETNYDYTLSLKGRNPGLMITVSNELIDCGVRLDYAWYTAVRLELIGTDSGGTRTDLFRIAQARIKDRDAKKRPQSSP